MSEERVTLFVHPGDELYGADRCLLALAVAAASRGRAIVVLPADTSPDGPLSKALVAAGVDVRRVDYLVLRRRHRRVRAVPRLAWRSLAGTLTLLRVIRRERVTLVHTNTLAAVGSAIAARVARVPHVWHVHESISDEPRAVRVTYRVLLRLTRGPVVANALAPATALTNGSRALIARIRVVANGVDIERFAPGARASEGPLVVTVAGRLSPRKGIAQALEAVALLVRDGVPVRLWFVGDPPPGEAWRRAAYAARARALGISDLVTIEPFAVDIAPALAATDVLLLPSQRPESFPLVVLEGMAAGCAVVATRNGGGSDEQLIDGVTGIYCGRSPAEIAAAITRLARDPALRTRLGRAARAAVARDFSQASFVAGLTCVHDEAVRQSMDRRSGIRGLVRCRSHRRTIRD